MPTLILRPARDGACSASCSSGNGRYALINDIAYDDDSTYIYHEFNSTTQSSPDDIFTCQPDEVVHGKIKITSIKEVFRTKVTNAGTDDIHNIASYVYITIDKTRYTFGSDSFTRIDNTSYVTTERTYNKTSQASSQSASISDFVIDDISNVQFQLREICTGAKGKSKNDNFQIRITQWYIELTYEEVSEPGTGSGFFFKQNNTWKEANIVYKKVSGAWVEQEDLSAIFSDESSGSASNYVYGGSV